MKFATPLIFIGGYVVLKNKVGVLGMKPVAFKRQPIAAKSSNQSTK